MQSALLAGATAAAAVTAACLYTRRMDSKRSQSLKMCAPPPGLGASYFLSGVMGGSGAAKSNTGNLAGVAVVPQDYRALMRDAILAADPSATIIDPAKVLTDTAPSLHPRGTDPKDYWRHDESVRQAFTECVELAASTDICVSYLPSASMGSAVELHAARAAAKLILVIAPGPMQGNWVVRSYADRVFEDVAELQAWLTERLIPDAANASRSFALSTEIKAAGAINLKGSITFVYSSNFEASRLFYGSDLSLSVRADKGSVIFYALPGGASSLGVVQQGFSAAANPPRSARQSGADTVMLCLLITDVQETFERIVARGRCTVEQPPRQNALFGIFNALVRDPDGYLVELQCFLDQAEQERFTGA